MSVAIPIDGARKLKRIVTAGRYCKWQATSLGHSHASTQGFPDISFEYGE